MKIECVHEHLLDNKGLISMLTNETSMLQLIRIFDDSIESKATPIVNTDDWNAISRGWSGGLNKYKFNITQISKAEALGIFKIELSLTFLNSNLSKFLTL